MGVKCTDMSEQVADRLIVQYSIRPRGTQIPQEFLLSIRLIDTVVTGGLQSHCVLSLVLETNWRPFNWLNVFMKCK